jgi:hypothetical protein
LLPKGDEAGTRVLAKVVSCAMVGLDGVLVEVDVVLSVIFGIVSALFSGLYSLVLPQ